MGSVQGETFSTHCYPRFRQGALSLCGYCRLGVGVSGLSVMGRLVTRGRGKRIRFGRAAKRLRHNVRALYTFLGDRNNAILFNIASGKGVVKRRIDSGAGHSVTRTVQHFRPFTALRISCVDVRGASGDIVTLSTSDRHCVHPFSCGKQTCLQLRDIASSVPRSMCGRLLVRQNKGCT